MDAGRTARPSQPTAASPRDAAPATTVAGPVTSTLYSPCSGISEVRIEVVDNLTHLWPETAGYNASIRVVDFLRRFTRP